MCAICMPAQAGARRAAPEEVSAWGRWTVERGRGAYRRYLCLATFFAGAIFLAAGANWISPYARIMPPHGSSRMHHCFFFFFSDCT